MAEHQIGNTNGDTIVYTLQRIEATLAALPDELAASRVVSLSEDEAKEILAKRYARLNHYEKIDNKNLKDQRLSNIFENIYAVGFCIVAVFGLWHWLA